jgi:hypothetical protein
VIAATDEHIEKILAWLEEELHRLRQSLHDRKALRTMKPLIGSVNQFSDSTDVLESPTVCKRLRVAFR